VISSGLLTRGAKFLIIQKKFPLVLFGRKPKTLKCSLDTICIVLRDWNNLLNS